MEREVRKKENILFKLATLMYLWQKISIELHPSNPIVLMLIFASQTALN